MVAERVGTKRAVGRVGLQRELQAHGAECVECNLCVRECKFLQNHGTPKQIALAYDSATAEAMAFGCSLCTLCAAVCPVKLNPGRMFLEMRREAVAGGLIDFKNHGTILAYERRGSSKFFSYYALPAGCDTVFFPGCALPGSRPATLSRIFDHLQSAIPTLGLVLDCCSKPSHDLGRESYFLAMFGELCTYLRERGVRNILVACPNCYQVFRQYGQEFQTRTVYDLLLEIGPPAAEMASGTVALHDPCSARWEPELHAAVRELLARQGLRVEETKHRGRKTFCCGEGGSVACLEPELAHLWGQKRRAEVEGRHLFTYCAGCASYLGRHTPTSHLLDLLVAPAATMAGRAEVAQAPWTYLNRWRLKKRFQKRLAPATSRERTFSPPPAAGGKRLWPRLLLLAAMVALVVAIRLAGVGQYLEPERLRAAIAGYGPLAPLLYILLYAVTPVLFLPGLPMTIAGGILFGPLWGVVYALTGATVGACSAFLVSRYLGREWVAGKLSGAKWRQLDTLVESHGWKAVAVTRLIPLFPFNLLNYAFGLTKVGFLPYALASLLCMAPATIAFIVFSSSLLDLVKGKISPPLLVGGALLLGLAFLPKLYKRWQLGKRSRPAA